MERVILLNSDYTFLNVLSWKKAVTLIVKGKVEVLKATDKIIHNMEKTVKIAIPLILRLLKLVRTLYKTKVPFSKANVIARDNFSCVYCGKKRGNFNIDHLVPKSRGGKSTWENCVSSCKKCNSKKSNRLPSEAGMFLKKRPYQPTIHEFLQLKMNKLGIKKILEEYVYN
uniref:Putative homing endonuclease n=1 Tax=viral metagenome TaxID=1070528 RepID=A0A6M3JS80_9ZZZZ